MSNPTSNYSFQMPTSTDLVTDLPADFEVFGQAVDTQMKTNADAAIAKSIVTTKGDLIVATGSGTVVRQGVGTNGQVLMADSTQADGVIWGTPASGSMTLLSTTSLSGASVTVSSISQSYKDLMFRIKDVYTSVNENYIQIRYNGDTSANYWFGGIERDSTYQSSYEETALIYYNCTSSTNNKINTFQAEIKLGNYTSTGVRIGSFISTSKVSAQNKLMNAVHKYIGTSAVSSITVATSNSFSGGTLEIWGIN